MSDSIYQESFFDRKFWDLVKATLSFLVGLFVIVISVSYLDTKPLLAWICIGLGIVKIILSGLFLALYFEWIE